MPGVVEIEFDVECETRDGTVLRADIYRAPGGGVRPVLLSRLPYGKQDGHQLSFLDPIFFARAGYLVVVQDTRGCGSSDGEWLPLMYETDDGHDAVEWAAQLPGSNGRVCMWGGSYYGNTQWQAAGAAPPHLVAIAPSVTWFDAQDGLFSRGGARELGLSLRWALFTGLDFLTRQHTTDSASRKNAVRNLARDIDELAERTIWEVPTASLPAVARHQVPELGFERNLVAPDTAKRVSPARWADVPAVPTLHIGGWYDVFLQGTLDAFMAQHAAGIETRAVIGPWEHNIRFGSFVGQVEFGLAADGSAIDLERSVQQLQKDWFDRWTSDEPPPLHDASLDDMPLQIFVMGENVWRTENEWPPTRAVDTALFLAPDGILTTAPPSAEHTDEFESDPRNPVPTYGGNILIARSYPAGPLNQEAIEVRDDVLVYTGEVLDADLEVTGRVKAVIRGTATHRLHDWVVRVCDVHPSGTSINVVDGIARLDGSAQQTIEVDLWSTSWLFKKGHRIRVQVTGSCFPRWDRPGSLDCDDETALPVIRQRLHLGGSSPTRVILSVIRR